MPEILIRVNVDDAYADTADRTGVTEAGFELIHETIGDKIGDVIDVARVHPRDAARS